MTKKCRGKSKNNEPAFFAENAIYTLKEAAEILHRNPDTIRHIARNKRIKHRLDSAGYLFTGWAIKEYVEGRFLADQE